MFNLMKRKIEICLDMFGHMVCIHYHSEDKTAYVSILGKSVFPDYFYPPTKIWWKNQILTYHKKIEFDGLWIDMK